MAQVRHITPAWGPLKGVPCWREADGSLHPVDESPALGMPIPVVAFEDPYARGMRGRNGAAGAMKAESDRRGWGLTGDQCIERAGVARGRADRRKGG